MGIAQEQYRAGGVSRVQHGDGIRRSVKWVSALAVVFALVVSMLGISAPASAAPTYSISGKVVLNNLSTLLPATEATVLASTDPSTSGSAGSATTDSAGGYTITGLSAGTYFLYLDYTGTDSYQSTWLRDPAYTTVPDFPVVVTNSNVTAPTGTFSKPGTIAGHVTLGAPGVSAGAGEVSVRFSTEATRSGPWSADSAGVLTDAEGNYSLPNVSAGYYRIHFVYVGSGSYGSAYYASTTTPLVSEAAVLAVRSATTETADGNLLPEINVTGQISLGTSSKHAAAGDVTISLQYWDPRNNSLVPVDDGTSTTDASGKYSFSGLANIGIHATYTYNGPDRFQTTTVVDYSYPYATPSLVEDEIIPSLHTVTGHVYLGSTARSATAGEVDVSFNNGLGSSVSVPTDANGNYSISGLATGYYIVSLHYNGTEEFADDTLAVDECPEDRNCSIDLTTDRAGISATLPFPNQVTGRVANENGAALSGMKIAAFDYDPTSGALVGETDTHSVSDGSYSFGALLDGNYEFVISDPTGFYGTQVIGTSSERVPLIDRGPLNLYTTDLFPAVTISGSVIAVGGSAADFANGNVTAELMTQTGPGGTWTPTGTYFPVRLSGGAYRFTASMNPGQYKFRIDYHGASGNATSYSATFVAGNGLLTSVGALTVFLTHPDSTVADQSFDATTTGLSVSGWAAWPASPSTSVGLAVNIGSAWYPVTANQAKSLDSDAIGTNHGFSFALPAAPGQYDVCLWTTEPSGPAEELGCGWEFVPDLSRTAVWVDSLTGSSAGVSVSGFAVYPQNFAGTVGVALNIGSGWYGLTANQPTSEGLVAYPGAGLNHGFSGTFSIAPGTYNACVWVTEPTGPAHIESCRTVTVPTPPRTVARIDSITGTAAGVTASGFAVYPSSFATNVTVAVNIGSSWYGFTANQANSEVPTAVSGADANHGFGGVVPLGPGTYSACVWVTEPSGPAVELGCQNVTVPARPHTVAVIDSVVGGVGSFSVAGWAVFPDSLPTAVGIAVNVGSSWYGLTANQASAEAASAYPLSIAAHGFAGVIAEPSGTYNACIWTSEPSGPAVNVGCHSVTVTSAPPAIDSFETATAVAGGIQVTGYSEFPTSPGTAIVVAANIGSDWYGFTANGANVRAPGHGFTGFIARPHGTYSVCLWTTEPAGPAGNFGCKSVTVP